MIKKPILIFFSTVFILSSLFFFLPINLFEGKALYKEGLNEYTVTMPLSLSYFLGIGYNESDMMGIESFYLTAKGILMAVIFILGFPTLLAFRVYFRIKHREIL